MPLLAALLAGAGVAAQSRVNGDLAARTGDAWYAAAWSFGSGLVVLLFMLALSGRSRAGLARAHAEMRAGRLPWWFALAGLIGACFVVVQAWSVPLLGVAMFMIGVVGGQTASSLLVDRVGLSPSGRQQLTPGRVAAGGAALVGVVLAALGRSSPTGPDAGGSGAALALGLVVGVSAASVVQQALNGRIGAVAGTPVVPTLFNFAAGVGLIALVGAVRAAAGGMPRPATLTVPPHLLLGGMLGLAFVMVTAWVIGRLGALITTLALLSGQLAGALALDLLDPQTRAGLTPLVLAGVMVTFVAAAVATAQGRPGGRRSPRQ